MKICHFTSSGLDYHYFRDISRGLTAAGHTVLLGTLGSHPRPLWMDELPNSAYFAMRVRRRSDYGFATLRLARELRGHAVDICQSHLFEGGLVGLPATVLARRPRRIIMRHHIDQHQIPKRPVHVQLDRLMASTAECTVVPSHAARDYMRSQETLRRASIEVIPIGFDFDELAAASARRSVMRDEFGLEDSFVVGFVGRLVQPKGLAHLLDAVAGLRSVIPEIRLLLVGDGPDEWLRAAIDQRGLRDCVVEVGFRPDAPACMAAMDVLVLPSLSESLPQVVIEAMGVGVAVIATPVGDTPRVIESGRTGLLVDVGDTAGLTNALGLLHRDPALSVRLAKQGQESVRTSYPASRMIVQHLELYERLIGAAAAC